jgi:hypothetical protein
MSGCKVLRNRDFPESLENMVILDPLSQIREKKDL